MYCCLALQHISPLGNKGRKQQICKSSTTTSRHGNKTSLASSLLYLISWFLSLFSLIALGTGKMTTMYRSLPQLSLLLTICLERRFPRAFSQCCIFLAQIAGCTIMVGCLHNRVVIVVVVDLRGLLLFFIPQCLIQYSF